MFECTLQTILEKTLFLQIFQFLPMSMQNTNVFLLMLPGKIEHVFQLKTIFDCYFPI